MIYIKLAFISDLTNRLVKNMDAVLWIIYILTVFICVFMGFRQFSQNLKSGRGLESPINSKGLSIVVNTVICGLSSIMPLGKAVLGICFLAMGQFLAIAYIKRKSIKIYADDPVLLGFYNIELKNIVMKTLALLGFYALIIMFVWIF